MRALGSTGRGTEGAHRAPDGRAFTSDLSAQDFFRLLAAGAVPVAFVLGVCVYPSPIVAMQSLRQAPEPGNGDLHPGHLRAAARAGQDAGGGHAGAGLGRRRGERRGQQSRLGRARDRSSPPEPPSAASATTPAPETSPKPTFTLGLDGSPPKVSSSRRWRPASRQCGWRIVLPGLHGRPGPGMGRGGLRIWTLACECAGRQRGAGPAAVARPGRDR